MRAFDVALYLMAERQTYLERDGRAFAGERCIRAMDDLQSGDEFLARATGLGMDFDKDVVDDDRV